MGNFGPFRKAHGFQTPRCDCEVSGRKSCVVPVMGYTSEAGDIGSSGKISSAEMDRIEMVERSGKEDDHLSNKILLTNS